MTLPPRGQPSFRERTAGVCCRRPGLKVVALLLLAVVCGSCARGCTSRKPPILLIQEMDNQPKYLPQAESGFFADGGTMQLPVEGTVARGDLREDVVLYTGRDSAGAYASNPLPVTEAFLERGRERYGIYCTPCHGDRGDGQGMLTVRAGVISADLHESRFLEMPDGQIFDVITNGFGLMAGYRYPVSVRDRWAIVAYVRRLQEEGGEP